MNNQRMGIQATPVTDGLRCEHVVEIVEGGSLNLGANQISKVASSMRY